MNKVYVETFLARKSERLYRQSKIREEAVEQLNLFLQDHLSPQYEIINIIEEWNDDKTRLELIMYYRFKRYLLY